jgi:hypothetical protein
MVSAEGVFLTSRSIELTAVNERRGSGERFGGGMEEKEAGAPS